MKLGFQMVPPGPSYHVNTYRNSVSKRMKKPLFMLFTALILVSAVGFTLVYAQEDPALVAENLLDAVNASSIEVNNLFDAFIAGNGTFPQEDANEALAEAEALFAEAQTAFEAGEYEDAIELSTEALNKYGEASAELIVEEEPDDEPEEDEAEETFEKLGGYERALDRLEKLRDIAADLSEQGVDVTEATDMLDNAESILADIGAAIDLGEFEGLEALLEEANSLIGQATGLLRSNSGQKRVEKTEHFINQTRHHFGQLETKLFRIMAKYNISGEDEDAIRLQFQGLKDSLDELEGDVEKDNLKQLTRRLQHMVKESNEVGKENDDIDDDLIERVNDVSKKESKLNSYRERLEALAQLGYNNSEVGELLRQAEQLLNQTQNSLDEGDDETADDLIDEADDLIDEADDLLDDLEKQRRKHAKDDEDIQDKVRELKRKISRYRIEVRNRNRRGENTTGLENRLNELETALDDALTEEDVELIEDQIDELEDLIDDDSDEDKGNSGNAGRGNDDDDESEEPEEPEDEEEPEITG